MGRLIQGAVGILPAGALGVSFFFHLTRQLTQLDGKVFFLERAGSRSAGALKSKGEILIADPRGTHRLPTALLYKPELLTCHQSGALPEIVLVCPNPDQLLGVITSVVELLVRISDEGQLLEGTIPFPIFVLGSNGIYFQRLRQIFIEKIEEAILLGRLADLWPEIMPRIVGRLLRGVSIQTGVREGSGAETIYFPGPPGQTRLAGGDAACRERCCEVLSGRGGWFDVAAHSSATRLEFDKGMVNLTCNLLGQLHAIDDAGNFRALQVADIVVPANEAEIRECARKVFQVGQAVKAYGAREDFEEIFQNMLASCHEHDSHVPSSLQWIGLRLRVGNLEAKLTPTETWLLDPLIRYARSAGLEDAVHYFDAMKKELLEKLATAVKAGARAK